MSSVEKWLDDFCAAWMNKDVEAATSLFSQDVEYWETPFKKLKSFEELRREWQGVHEQYGIQVHTELFCSDNNHHAVRWKLSYTNKDKVARELAGTYLISLNDEGRCNYFYHTGELLE